MGRPLLLPLLLIAACLSTSTTQASPSLQSLPLTNTKDDVPPPSSSLTKPTRSLFNSNDKGPRHFDLHRLDAALNEHQRNERRLKHRTRRNVQLRRQLFKPKKSTTKKPRFPPQKGPAGQDLPAYKAEGTLSAEPDGVYYTVVRIGSAQDANGIPFTLIADTGSSTIAVPCKGCNCGNSKHYFDMFQSKTCTDQERKYSQCYGEGSCNSGKTLEDIMCFGPECDSAGGVRMKFGKLLFKSLFCLIIKYLYLLILPACTTFFIGLFFFLFFFTKHTNRLLF